MNKVEIYTKANCPYCEMAKQVLNQRKIPYTEIRIDTDDEKRAEMLTRSHNKRTVPQIFINDQSIGGYDDLAALVKSGKLDGLLNS